MHFYVGTTAGSEAIYLVELDSITGRLGEPRRVAEVKNPNFLAVDPAGTRLYAATESDDANRRDRGQVAVYAIDPVSSHLTELARHSTGGRGTCHISVTNDGRQALVANYSSETVASLSIRENGSLAAPATVVRHHGSGPIASRQGEPHPHCVVPDPSGRYALAADLGTDSIEVYDLRTDTLQLRSSFRCPAGCGPRHVAFHASGRVAYVLTEMAATVIVLAWDEENGRLALQQEVDSLPPKNDGVEYSSSEIAVHPTLPFLYAANRSDDTIAQFAINHDGDLNFLCHTSTGGRVPRHFSIDPTGQFMVIANQESGSINAFRLDRESGKPVSSDKAKLPTPMCIRFRPADANVNTKAT